MQLLQSFNSIEAPLYMGYIPLEPLGHFNGNWVISCQGSYKGADAQRKPCLDKFIGSRRFRRYQPNLPIVENSGVAGRAIGSGIQEVDDPKVYYLMSRGLDQHSKAT